MESKWLELSLNGYKNRDIETFINLEETLMLQNHFIRGWEIIPNTNEADVINRFYNVFKYGISEDTKEKCLEIFESKKHKLINSL